jgi:hypothetical protein
MSGRNTDTDSDEEDVVFIDRSITTVASVVGNNNLTNFGNFPFQELKVEMKLAMPTPSRSATRTGARPPPPPPSSPPSRPPTARRTVPFTRRPRSTQPPNPLQERQMHVQVKMKRQQEDKNSQAKQEPEQ